MPDKDTIKQLNCTNTPRTVESDSKCIQQVILKYWYWYKDLNKIPPIKMKENTKMVQEDRVCQAYQVVPNHKKYTYTIMLTTMIH